MHQSGGACQVSVPHKVCLQLCRRKGMDETGFSCGSVCWFFPWFHQEWGIGWGRMAARVGGRQTSDPGKVHFLTRLVAGIYRKKHAVITVIPGRR